MGSVRVLEIKPDVSSTIDVTSVPPAAGSAQMNLNETWWDLTVVSAPHQEDVVFWRLETFGFSGVSSQVRDSQLLTHAYVLSRQVGVLDLAALALALRQDALIAGTEPPRVSWEQMESEDWSVSWKAHWHPQEVADKILICPAWLEPPSHEGRQVLRMDPGMAFGTGVHPTTQLCLEALEMRLETWGDEPPPSRILDIGCGSGILSIAAVLLGAKAVSAVDTDPLAVKSTLYNRDLNQMGSQIEVAEGSLEKLSGPADGLVCNILTDVILDMIPSFGTLVQSEGWLILSGILVEQAKFVAETLEAHGWVVSALWKRGEWCCLNVRKAS